MSMMRTDMGLLSFLLRVMPGLVPGIHVLKSSHNEGVDGRVTG
jgi:hypothetical protein